jgi:hypothetical protein
MPMILQIARRASIAEEEMIISIIERSAILTLCKIMCISKDVCKDNIELIFEILMK